MSTVIVVSLSVVSISIVGVVVVPDLVVTIESEKVVPGEVACDHTTINL